MAKPLYKLLMNGRSPIMGCPWHLPRNGRRAGDWMPAVAGPLEECRSGYHLCTLGTLVEHVDVDQQIYRAESRGRLTQTFACTISHEARLTKHVGTATPRVLLRTVASAVYRASCQSMPEHVDITRKLPEKIYSATHVIRILLGTALRGEPIQSGQLRFEDVIEWYSSEQRYDQPWSYLSYIPYRLVHTVHGSGLLSRPMRMALMDLATHSCLHIGDKDFWSEREQQGSDLLRFASEQKG